MKLLERCGASSCVILFCASILSAQDGEPLYKRTCAACHDSGAERVPGRETLKAMTPERVLAAMESGAMIAMASRLSVGERRAVAEFITGKSLGRASATVLSPQAMCAEAHSASNDLLSGPQWSGWGANLANTRAQNAATAGFTAAEVPRLKLQWAFGFPGDVSASSQPTIAAGHVFVGSQGGKVYALNAAIGCVNWWFEAPASVRSAVVIGRIKKESGPSYAAFFGDTGGVVYGERFTELQRHLDDTDTLVISHLFTQVWGRKPKETRTSVCRQAGSNSVTFASAATLENSRNSPEPLCNLAFSVWNLGLPQFDRISLRVMQAGKPAVGIRLRVNLDRDSRSL